MSDVIDFGMGELPQLIPVSESHPSSACWDTRPPVDPRVSEAESRCALGDMSAIPLIQHLIETGVPDVLFTCLLAAVSSRNKVLVQQILLFGVKITEHVVEFAISIADLDILSLFVQFGWDIHQNLEWCSPPPLSFAVGPGANFNESVVSWFLSNGADADARPRIDITPLSYAVQHAPLRIIEILLNSALPVKNGQLLHYASFRSLDDCGQVCRLILEKCSFNVNDIMYHNDTYSYEMRKIVGLGTPLHGAAAVGRIESVEVLLQHGARQNILNSDGFTALEVAKRAKNDAVARFLEQHQNFSIKSNI